MLEMSFVPNLVDEIFRIVQSFVLSLFHLKRHTRSKRGTAVLAMDSRCQPSSFPILNQSSKSNQPSPMPRSSLPALQCSRHCCLLLVWHVQEVVKARERAASRKKFLDRARKAEGRGELREAQQNRRVSQRRMMRVLELQARGKAASNIQVSCRLYTRCTRLSAVLYLGQVLFPRAKRIVLGGRCVSSIARCRRRSCTIFTSFMFPLKSVALATSR